METFDGNNNGVEIPYRESLLKSRAKKDSSEMNKKLNSTNLIFEFIICLFAWFVFGLVVLPALTVILGTLYIFKFYIVHPWAKRRHADIIEPLNPYDAILAHDNYYGPGKSYANLGQCVILEGKLDVHKVSFCIPRKFPMFRMQTIRMLFFCPSFVNKYKTRYCQ